VTKALDQIADAVLAHKPRAAKKRKRRSKKIAKET
jgi:hypothetical protein